MPTPFSGLALQPLRPGDQPFCPRCRGTAVTFVAYYGDQSRVLLRCRCGKRGCVAEVVLQDEVINKMKTGGTAMFIIFDTPEAGIGIPVSLQGFGDALANLK